MTRAAWYPGATRRDGPARKAHGLRNRTTGAVYHSAVGSLATTLSTLDGASVSAWQLTNPKVGKMLQHYPLGILVYHARNGNSWTIGVENEGGPLSNVNEPLTQSQIDNLRDFSHWLVDQRWLPYLTRTGPKTGAGAKSLWEHREISATACPSERLSPVWAEIMAEEQGQEEEDEEMPTMLQPHGENAVVITNFIVKAPVKNRAHRDYLRASGVRGPIRVDKAYIDAIQDADAVRGTIS